MFDELKSGEKLCQLIHVLTQHKLNIENVKHPKRCHHISNVNKVLRYLEAHNVSHIHITFISHSYHIHITFIFIFFNSTLTFDRSNWSTFMNATLLMDDPQQYWV